MKKLILLFVVLLTGCASYDIQNAIHPENRVSYQKLPNMKPVFENKKSVNVKKIMKGATTNGAQFNNGFSTLFRREVEQNLVNTDTALKGKIVLEPMYFETNENTAWSFLGYPFFMLPQAIGVPMRSDTSKWELELSVIDKEGRRIANYSAEAEDTEYSAAFWGWKNSYTAATYQSYKKALNNIIIQLQNDIPTLSEKLK
ncbi:MAG: hypothetical protein J6N45_02135 [Alphaproteobacteria bacterium]|nr:hypothetical protein [Alphaproteobacteria bacterium]